MHSTSYDRECSARARQALCNMQTYPFVLVLGMKLFVKLHLVRFKEDTPSSLVTTIAAPLPLNHVMPSKTMSVITVSLS